MTHIFISYARPAEPQAHRMAEALRGLGYEVWRDDSLAPNEIFGEVIEERLRAASAVLVVWSAAGAKSHWVRAEADVAREAGSLVQVSVDGRLPPLPFNQMHCADLSGWTGDDADPAWRKVVKTLGQLVRASPTAPASGGEAWGGPKARPAVLLAVLPFDNLSGDPEIGFFSDGMSEEILQTIAGIPNLKVIGRSSSFQFRGAEKATANVAAKLKATHLLDGSVRRGRDRVRISATLTECASQTSLWSDRFDRDLSDVFALQDEIAGAVAEALKMVFSPTSEPRKVDPAAYDLYLRARSLVGTPWTAEQALDLLGAVVRLAPDFAAAWAAMAIARSMGVRWQATPAEFAERRAAVTEAAERALALNPASGVAYAALTSLEPPAAYVRRAALLQKALDAEPPDGETLKQMSHFCYGVGRVGESFSFAKSAWELDPLIPAFALAHAERLGDIGHLDAYYDLMREYRRSWPDNFAFLSSPMLTSAVRGDWDQHAALEREVETFGLTVPPHVAQVVALVRAPPEAARQVILGQLDRQLETTRTIELGHFALAYSLGLRDEAFERLGRASFDHLFTQEGANPDSRFLAGTLFGCVNDGLRRDPRFAQLCVKLGLGDYWLSSGQWPDCVSETAPFYDLKASVTALPSPGRLASA